MKIILTVLGLGFHEIQKITEMKQRHVHALRIMNRLIESDTAYRYNNDGQKPVANNAPDFPDRIPEEIPNFPPADTEDPSNQARLPEKKEMDKKENKAAKETQPLMAANIGIPEIRVKLLGISEMQGTHSNGKNVLLLEFENWKTSPSEPVKNDTPLLIAAKMGIQEMVEKIIKKFPVAIYDVDSDGKNVLLLAAENRQTTVFKYLLDQKFPDYLFHQVDKKGNSVLHLAAMLGEQHPWRIPGAALQMQWEIKWYKYVKRKVPWLSYAHRNNDGETARKIFKKTHEGLVDKGTTWLIKTSESCSVVSALIATVAFATSATVPGGLNQDSGIPVMENRTAFDIFSITSLLALFLSVTALVFFVAIITSRCQESDFKSNLPRKLVMGLTALFASIAAMLVSFCAGHTFILGKTVRILAVPIYAFACVPVTLFALAQLPLYFDLVLAACKEVPVRSYKVHRH